MPGGHKVVGVGGHEESGVGKMRNGERNGELIKGVTGI